MRDLEVVFFKANSSRFNDICSKDLSRNNTQTAVTNMTIKRILENKFINLTLMKFVFQNAFYCHVCHRSLCVISC